MTAFKIDQFKGIYPRTPPQLLPQQAGTVSTWVDHQYGELRGMKSPLSVRTLPNPAWSVYVFQQTMNYGDPSRFFSWQAEVDAVAAPSHAPQVDAIYYVTPGNKQLWKTRTPVNPQAGGEPAEQYKPGLPAPDLASWSLTTPAAPTPGAGVETRAYVITYVNAYGEEGPPSPARTLDVLPGTTVINIGMTIPSFVGQLYEPMRAFRIYRTQAGGAADEFYFVKQINLSFGQTSGTLATTDDVALVNEALTSYDNFPPPDMIGLAMSPSGALVGWDDNNLYFSREHKPWAWPKDNKITLPSAIVKVIGHGTGLLVLTRDRPYFVSGVPFESMPEPTPLEIPHPAIARSAVAQVAGATVYASQDGIVVVDGISGSLQVSERFFTREIWRQKYSENVVYMAFLYFNSQLLVYSRINAFTPFILRLNEPFESMTELPGLILQGAVVWPTTDGVFIFTGTDMREFAVAPQTVPLTWRSREVLTATPVNLGAAAARYTGSMTVKVYGDGVLRHTESLNSSTDTETTFTLPSGYTASRWQVEISGLGTFKSLRLANTARNLGSV